MISRENVTREALSDLEARREENLALEKARREEAKGKSPVVAALLEEREKLFHSGLKNAFSMPANAKAISEKMGIEITRLNANLRRALVACGLPEDYLQPVYHCPVCHDTGYVGEPLHEPCVCLKKAVLGKIYKNEGLQTLERENFSAFDEALFPDVPIEGYKSTQRAQIRRARAFCEQYADSFSADAGKGLILSGKTGLGKTFLMNCIAQRVLERGFSVVIVSAYRLVDVMRQYQFNGQREEEASDILGCDLLCIDDLGAEPMYREVTLSCLYTVIEERRRAGRALVVTTNMDSDNIYDKYDDRIGARLTDPSRMSKLTFVGDDVRRYISARAAVTDTP